MEAVQDPLRRAVAHDVGVVDGGHDREHERAAELERRVQEPSGQALLLGGDPVRGCDVQRPEGECEAEPEPSVEIEGDDSLLVLWVLDHFAPRCRAKSDGLRFRRKVRMSRYTQPKPNTSAAISASANATGLVVVVVVVVCVWVVVATLSV